MKRITLLIAIGTLAGVVSLTGRASRHANQEDTPAFITEIPAGYREWTFISVAHEEGNLNSFGSILGNDIAIKAYCDGKLPFPDGSIIAALHYRFVPSDATISRSSFSPASSASARFRSSMSNEVAYHRFILP